MGHQTPNQDGVLEFSDLELSEQALDDYDIEDELEDFLAADREPIAADPRFRDDLRERLWALVQDGIVNRPRSH
jgi:hypothetical protein